MTAPETSASPPCPDDIVKITVPTPYPVGPVNLYAVRGKVCTLVDVGPDTPESRVALESGLEAAGLSLEKVGLIIITHAHLDHHGLVPYVVQRSGAEVAAHPAGWRRFRGGDPEGKAFFAGFFRELGVPAADRQTAMQVLEAIGRSEPRVEVDRWIGDSDVIAAGDSRWQVLHTPGHGASQICLYRPDDRVLISSDHLLAEISSNALMEPPPLEGGPRPHSLVRYMDALHRVAEMDVSLCLPGHGENFCNHRALIRERMAFYETRLGHILAILQNDACTAYEVARQLFAPFDPERLFLGLSEVVGHLDVLLERGWVKVHKDGEVLRYLPTDAGDEHAVPQQPQPQRVVQQSVAKESVVQESMEVSQIDLQQIFTSMQERLQGQPDKLQGENYVVQFELSGDDGGDFYLAIDDGTAQTGEGTREDAGVTVSMTAADFKQLVAGELSGTAAFMSGRLRVKGNMGLAMKLQSFLG